MLIARSLRTISAAASVLAAAVAGPVAADAATGDAGDIRLAKVLDGRVRAGPAVDCIRTAGSDRMSIIDGVGFAFERGGTLWVNQPNGARFINDLQVPVIEKWNGSQLCRFDRVELRDRTAYFAGPVLLLGEFVPYRRPEQGNRP